MTNKQDDRQGSETRPSDAAAKNETLEGTCIGSGPPDMPEWYRRRQLDMFGLPRFVARNLAEAQGE